MSSAPRFKMALPFLHEANWMRQTARFVIAGWLLPVLFAFLAAFSPAPAQAQNPVQTVVVLDFAVANGLDPLLGRKAADGLAVELQRSGDYEVVPRARVEETVAQQAGLQPPFNDTAQKRLAEAVSARSVFSGRILAVNVVPGKSATVNVEVRQLDSVTGDYINGTQVIEPAEQRLSAVANEILIDEAINKAVFSAVRSMRQTTLPVGAVLNTTREDIELSIGARNGVAVGQRYSVLRDVYNRGKNVTTRDKIAEVTIINVENDQSTAKVSAGGAGGVRTGDRIRQIFVPGTYPVSIASSNGGSVTPVTAPPTSRTQESFVKKSGKGLLGLVGLAALVGLVGFGGGGGNSSPDVDAPEEQNPTGVYPSVQFSFSPGFSGINFSQTLQRESVIAYVVYRGTTPNFVQGANTVQYVIDASGSSSSSSYTVGDPPGNPQRRSVTISILNNGTSASRVNLVDTAADIDDPDRIEPGEDDFVIEYTQRPLTFGTTYYYRVARISAERVRTEDDDDDTDSTIINITPTLSAVSAPTGGYTPLLRPEVQSFSPDINGNSFDTDDAIIRVNTDFTALTDNSYNVPFNANVGTGADQFRFEVSKDSNFSPSRTFTSQIYPVPTAAAGADLVFDLDNIFIPSTPSDPFVAGSTTLYIRASSRKSTDATPTFRVGPAQIVPGDQVVGVDSISTSRFLAAPAGVRGGGVSVGRGGAGLGGASAGTYNNPRILKPR